MLARRLYTLSQENSNTINSIFLCININLLQDAVEYFLLAVAESLNVSIPNNTRFDKYIDLINEKIPNKLPYERKIQELNKLRVNSKHFGSIPNKSDVERLQITVREFFDDVSSSILKQSFASISLIDLLRDDEAKELLKEAEKSFDNSKFEDCLTYCRKAIFVRIESQFDISPFENYENHGVSGLKLFGSRAPYYARNKEYVEKNVTEPTDFIVFDHDYLEMYLMENGMDSVSFWNIIRLTPAIYRRKIGDEWIIKREFSKLENEGILERAEYVLYTTINLFVTADQKYATIKSPKYQEYYIILAQDQIPIYKKADLTSEKISATPPGITKLCVDYTVPALNGIGTFYHVDEIGMFGYIIENAVRSKADNIP